MSRKDPLRILDAVYAFHLDERAWVRAVLEATLPFTLGQGIAGYVAEIGARVGARAVTTIDCPIPEETVPALLEHLPVDLWRRIHAPMPTNRNKDLLRRVATEGFDAEILLQASGGEMMDCWGALGGDLGVETMLLCVPCAPGARLPTATRRVFDAVAAHLGAALRLRRVLGRAPREADVGTDAVLSHTGRVLDARGSLEGPSVESLVGAVRRLERARSRKVDADEKLALWKALVEGRWSIVETEERDGKRVLLACRNAPPTAAIRRLSVRERAIVQCAALGHPYKYIAYELGISVSSVAATLKTAMRKLGLRSRIELIRTFGWRNDYGPRVGRSGSDRGERLHGAREESHR